MNWTVKIAGMLDKSYELISALPDGSGATFYSKKKKAKIRLEQRSFDYKIEILVRGQVFQLEFTSGVSPRQVDAAIKAVTDN